MRSPHLHAVADLNLWADIRREVGAWNCPSLPLLPRQATPRDHTCGTDFARVCRLVLFLEELAAARALDDRGRDVFLVAERRQSLAILNCAELNGSPFVFQLFLVVGLNRLELAHGLLRTIDFFASLDPACIPLERLL